MPKVAKVAAVAVTKRLSLLLLACLAIFSQAAVLDDDRVDILYQTYNGGGIEVEAPAIVARKKLAENFALSGNYLVDMVSGASIDAEVGASPYEEERTEYGVGIEYLKDKSTLNLHYTNSSENDYEADTLSLSVTQDFFGDLSTVNMGLSLGDDVIGNSTDPGFEENAKHYSMDFGWTQIISKNFITNIAFNKTVDEGFLRNPYRFIRIREPDDPTSWFASSENYPQTRSSDAWSVRGRYFIASRKVVYASYRAFQDTWGITASNYELGYTFAYRENWTLDFRYRAYEQTDADFYRDLFDYVGQTTFYGRDKELSQMSDQMFSFSVGYDFALADNQTFKKTSVYLFLDHIRFDYDNFRDARVDTDAGEEPLYAFSANLIRIMFSIWF